MMTKTRGSDGLEFVCWRLACKVSVRGMSGNIEIILA